MVKEPPDFELRFLDFSSSAETGEQELPDIEESAEILDAYSQAVTNVKQIIPDPGTSQYNLGLMLCYQAA